MMRAIPTASLRSLLLICILSTALAWRASMQTTGTSLLELMMSVHWVKADIAVASVDI
jgi:hypothetical protein